MTEQNPQITPMTDELVKSENPAKRSWTSFISKNFLGISILLAGVMISSSVIYTNQASLKSGTAQIQQDAQAQAPGTVKADVSVDDDPSIGNKNAKVVVVEFSDFQCPFCRVFWKDSFSQIKKDYIDTGKILFVYRDFPLSSIHPMAEQTAEAGACALEQGKFWEFHDKAFSEQDKLGQNTISYTVKDIKSWASGVGLNSTKFNQCLDSGKYKNEVQKDTNDGSLAGVNGTPTVFINGRMVVGAQPYTVFKSIIEEELKK